MKSSIPVECLQRYQDRIECRDSQTYLRLEFNEFVKELRWLKDDAGHFFLLDLSVIDLLTVKAENSKRFQLFIWLLNMENHHRLCVIVDFDQEQTPLPSLGGLFANALVLEREIFDMFGISFGPESQQRLFNPDSFNGHPLRKDFENKNDILDTKVSASQNSRERLSLRDGYPEKTWFTLGPYLAQGQSLLKLEYTLDKEKIQECVAETGFYHRGVEKIAEQMSYQSLFSLLNKLNHCSPEFTSVLWAETLEKAAGLMLPERAQALRMVLCEVARIQDHLQCLAMGAMEAQLHEVFALCLKERERLILLMQKITQRRAQHQWVCVGGLAYDLPLGWMTLCLSTMQELTRSLNLVHQKCVRSRQWSEKTKAGPVRARDALEWGFSGPLLRAAGVNYDLRKVSGSYFYNDVDFEIPLGINGDSYDRFLVRIEEVFQSLSIISQVIDHLPPGEVCFKEQGALEQSLTQLMGSGLDYHSIESPTGELGITLMRTNADCPYRLKIRTSSLMAMAALKYVLPGQEVDQALMTMHSFNLVHGEIDK